MIITVKIILVITFFLLLLLLEIFVRKSLNRIRISSNHERLKPPYSLTFKQLSSTESFGGDFFWKMFKGLAYYAESDRQIINIEKTLNKNIISWNKLALVKDNTLVESSYLVLLEVKKTKDFLLKSYEALFTNLGENGLDVTVLKFYDNLDLLYRTNNSKVITRTLLPFKKYERIIVISDFESYINPYSGLIDNYFSDIFPADSTFCISTKDTNKWGLLERQFQKSYIFVPCSSNAIGIITNIDIDKNEVESKFFSEDSINYCNQVYSSFTSEGKDFINVLQSSLTEVQFIWVAASAIHPDLNWDLALCLGENIQYSNSNEKLKIRDIIDVSRLIWFRDGYIPERYRIELLKALPRKSYLHLRKIYTSMIEMPSVDSLAYEKYKINLLINDCLTNKKFSLSKLKIKNEILLASSTNIYNDVATLKRAGLFLKLNEIHLPDSIVDTIAENPWLGQKYRLFFLLTLFLLTGFILNAFDLLPFLFKLATIFALLSFIPASIALISVHAKAKQKISGINLAGFMIFFNMAFALLSTFFLIIFDPNFYSILGIYLDSNSQLSLIKFNSLKSFTVATALSVSMTISTLAIFIIRKEYIRPNEGVVYFLTTWILLANVLSIYTGIVWWLTLIMVSVFFERLLSSFK